MDLHDRSVYMTFEQRWTPRSVLRRALCVIREEGMSSLWFKLLGETCYRRMWLIASSIKQIRETDVQHSDLRFRWLEREDLASYLSFRPDAGRERIRKRFSLGHRCYAAFSHDQIVFTVWAVTEKSWIPYLFQDLYLDEKEVYFYEVWTSPAYRGQGIACAAMLAFLSSLKEDRFKRVVGAVMPENKAALELFHKTGFRICGKLRTLKIGKWRFEISGKQRISQIQSPSHEAEYWNKVLNEEEKQSLSIDPFLLNLKNQAYRSLIRNWRGIPKGTMLKTDLFEEAISSGGIMEEPKKETTAVGIDISEKAVRCAAARKTAANLFYVVSDVRNLPFQDNTFDFIFSPSTLDHFDESEDLKISLVELHRVLRVDGRVIVILDNRQNVFDPLMRLLNRLGKLPYFVGFSLNAKMLRVYLAKAGFQLLDTTAILHNPRLVAAAMMLAARKCGSKFLLRLIERILIGAQRLAKTSLCYWTGSFIAVHAKKPG